MMSKGNERLTSLDELEDEDSGTLFDDSSFNNAKESPVIMSKHKKPPRSYVKN
jgi:hypothetical protein